MITAQEARELAEGSKDKVTALVRDQVFADIRDAVMRGQKYVPLFYEEYAVDKHPIWRELEALGYEVTWEGEHNGYWQVSWFEKEEHPFKPDVDELIKAGNEMTLLLGRRLHELSGADERERNDVRQVFARWDAACGCRKD